jgi:hypothetical protein
VIRGLGGPQMRPESRAPTKTKDATIINACRRLDGGIVQSPAAGARPSERPFPLRVPGWATRRELNLSLALREGGAAAAGSRR